MLKKILKWTGGILLLLVIALGVLIALNYKADIPLEELKAKYETPNSDYISVLGMDVHYSVDGEGDKPFVLIHGTGASLNTWDAWVKELGSDFKIYRFDVPGFGLTGPNPEKRYDLAFYNVFMESLMDKLRLKNFHIAGNSFGGFLAWNYTLRHPERVDKMVLLDASGYPEKDKELPIGFRLAKHKQLSKILEKVTPRSIVEKTTLAAYENDELVSEEIKDRYFELLLRKGNREAIMGRMQQINNDNYFKIKNIKVPTLILWGDKDELVPVSHAYRFHKDIQGSDLVVYENIGHVPMEEIPEQSAKDTREFLSVITAEK